MRAPASKAPDFLESLPDRSTQSGFTREAPPNSAQQPTRPRS
jgi:hypothetical protein